MKIIFMLNLAHTPSTTSQRYINAHSREKASMDVYEIYWNIKFNHGMESINNNFRIGRRSRDDWMDGGREEELNRC